MGGHNLAVAMKSDFDLLDHNITTANCMLTLKASLISPVLRKPGLDRTRLLACVLNERGKTLPKAWGKSLPKDLTGSLKGGDTQFIDKQKSSTQGGRVGIFFTYEQSSLSTACH